VGEKSTCVRLMAISNHERVGKALELLKALASARSSSAR
jgi:hypothetical protein